MRKPFPAQLSLRPVSRWPLTLPGETIQTVLDQTIPCLPREANRSGQDDRAPSVSIIVVSFNNLVFNRLCLESVLANTADAEFELIVIDNGSRDGTVTYLRELATLNACVRVHLNTENLGFAAACNQGLSLAHGEVLVLLNNDTVVSPRWLEGICEKLRDPTIGMVGPVTNRCGNEAQIEVSYSTYGELVGFARELGEKHLGQILELPMLVMFCVAIRRQVYERIGGLDERFEVGLFEDEDYCVRLVRAGYRLVCAEDVFVHHFGQASIGKLAANGDYGDLFHLNRKKFENKWGLSWTPHRQRRSAHYQELVGRVQHVIESELPRDATVLVVSKGDDDLLTLTGRIASHFPATADDVYAGHHPKDSAEAIAHLEKRRKEGGQFLLIPAHMFWWLEYYPEFASHLAHNYSYRDHEGVCVIYQLADMCSIESKPLNLPAFDCPEKVRLNKNLVTVIFSGQGKIDEVSSSVERLLRFGDNPHRLLCIDDTDNCEQTRQMLRETEERQNHVVYAAARQPLTRVATINLGLRLAPGDVVLVWSPLDIGPDWLEIMGAKAYGRGGVATVSRVAAGESISPVLPAGSANADTDCIFITRAALRRAGLLDERQFADFKGAWTEFCRRTQKAGLLHLTDHTATGEIQAESEQPCLLFIAHAGSGGVSMNVRDLALATACSYRTFLLQTGLGSWSLFQPLNGKLELIRQYRFSGEWRPQNPLGGERERVLAGICHSFAIDLVNIHHLLCTGPGLIDLLKALNLPVVLSFHDYYAICPTSHLIDDQGTFCAGRCTPGLGDCPVDKAVFTQGIAQLKHAYVHQHRDSMNQAVRKCDAYTAPSHSVIKRLVKSIQLERCRDIHVIGHGVDLERRNLATKPPVHGPVKIVCLGNLNEAKGLHLIDHLMKLDSEHGRVFEFHFMGGCTGAFKTRTRGGVFHGPYKRDECLQKLSDIAPSFSLLASVCEETFSYTLSESWAAGLPVFATDRGALKERIELQGGGWLFNPEDPDAFYSGMRAVLESPGAWSTAIETIKRIKLMSVSEEADQMMRLFRDCLGDTSSRSIPVADVEPQL